MNEDTLLRWAKGTLSEAEELEVYRWMITCTDPRLPDLLQGVLEARRQLEADRVLAARGGLWAQLVEAWTALLDAGAAQLVSPQAEVVFASEASTEAWASLEAAGQGEVDLVVRRDGMDVVAFVTTDAPSVTRLEGWQGTSWEELRIPRPSGPRPTVWVFRLTAGVSSARSLEEMLGGDGERVALRWFSED